MWALFGLFGCIMIVIFSGWPSAYLLSAGHEFLDEHELKPRPYLAADVAGAYAGVSNLLIILYPLSRPSAPIPPSSPFS